MASQIEETHPRDAQQRTRAASRPDENHASSPVARPSRIAGWDETPVYESDSLFGDTNEVGIVHEGALYRLKITRQGKLVLNK